MPNFATIVCPVDFSDHSQVSLARAGVWARHFRARLIVVTVVEPLLVNAAAATYDMDLVRDDVLPELREFTAKTFAARGADAPTPEAVVLVGEPAAEIASLAQREQAGLIVIATHGLSGYRKMLLGSTTEKILRDTTVPVLIAPPSDKLPAPMDLTAVGRVLVPIDFDDASVTEVRTAADIAQSLGVPLLLVHVVAPVRGPERFRLQLDTHNSVQRERAEQQIRSLVSDAAGATDIESVVAAGSPADEIAQLAVDRGAGLIVMGIRRKKHMFAPRPGSIAYRILGLAPAMVLALPSGD